MQGSKICFYGYCVLVVHIMLHLRTSAPYTRSKFVAYGWQNLGRTGEEGQKGLRFGDGGRKRRLEIFFLMTLLLPLSPSPSSPSSLLLLTSTAMKQLLFLLLLRNKSYKMDGPLFSWFVDPSRPPPPPPGSVGEKKGWKGQKLLHFGTLCTKHSKFLYILKLFGRK